MKIRFPEANREHEGPSDAFARRSDLPRPLDACRHPRAVVPRAVADGGRATSAPAAGLDGMAAVHERTAAAAVCARSGRGCASAASTSPPGRRSSAPAVHAVAALRPVRWQRGGVEGPERERGADLFAAVSGEPPRARRTPWRRRVREDAGRSAGQTDRHRRGLLIRRGDRQGRPGVGAVAQRGRQPHAAPQGRRGLHADGRARRPLHRAATTRRNRARSCRSGRRRSSRGSCTLRSTGRARTRRRSSSGSTHRYAA